MALEIMAAVALALVGALLGSISVWYVVRNRVTLARNEGRAEGNAETARANERASFLGTELERERTGSRQKDDQQKEIYGKFNALTDEAAGLRVKANRVATLDAQIATLQDAKESLASEVTRLNTTLGAERKENAEKLELLDQAKEKLSDAFKALASDILEDKSKRFTEQNKTNISQILEPLSSRIKEFKEKVDQVYVNDSNDRVALKTQVEQLMSVTTRVSDDAKSLADALKGLSKVQGNLGEMILETVLEKSGLRKGQEYELRGTFHREDGTRAQPDVVIRLPEERHLVVDAKVSLTDYERYANATNEDEAKDALACHVASVRRHIRELSEKDYPSLYELKSLDLTVMFVPVEPAFAAAIAADSGLWDEALKRNVLLVSPSSLLFVLRTVAYLWRQEAQARHVKDIAKCGADLYDKFVGFVGDIQELGHHLQKAQSSFEDASGKLSAGRGNLISRADKLRSLGVTPKKLLPAELVDAAALQEAILEGESNSGHEKDEEIATIHR